jgi:hypothetical protein
VEGTDFVNRKRTLMASAQTSEKSQKKSTNGDLITFGALVAINSGINLNLDFGFNHTISGVFDDSRFK